MINISLIEQKFLRSKNRHSLELTKIWSNTSDLVQNQILSNIKLDREETPIIGYFKDNTNWWIITNNAIYSKKTEVTKFQFKDIKRVNIDVFEKGDVSKSEINTIQIITSSISYDLQIELLSWPLIYPILQFVIKKH